MDALIDHLGASGHGLWLDHHAYAARLLAGGHAPWSDVDAAVGWMRKAQALLRSDAVGVPVAAVAGAWLGQHPELIAAMGAGKRATYPLRALLADEAMRAHLAALCGVLRSGFAGSALVLVLPSPRRWLALAFAQAHGGGAAEVADDAVDGAAVHVAGFLRSFADCGLDGLLFEESPDSAPGSAEGLALYQAAFNVASHYRWNVGLRLPGNASVPSNGSLDFVVASEPVAGVVSGVEVPESFWQGGDAPPCPPRGFRFAEIPVDANPEIVLERVSTLR